MQLTLNTADVCKVLHTCFCDGGTELLRQSGFYIDYNKNDYTAAKLFLKDPCLEDVYIAMLKQGFAFYFVDSENENEKTQLKLNTALENFKKPEAAEDLVLLLSDGDYDAIPCYRLLQIAVFGEVLYG